MRPILLTLLAMLLLAPALRAEVYSHPKPKFEITVPDSYMRLSPPRGAPPMHCIFGKNFRDNVSDMVIVVDNPHVTVAQSVQAAPVISTLDFTPEFKTLSKGVMAWNGTSIAIYEISCRSQFFSRTPDLLRIHIAHMPTADGALRIMVAGLDKDASEVQATFQQVVASLRATLPGATTAVPPPPTQQPAEEEGTNPAAVIIPILMLLALAGGAVFILRRRTQEPVAPPEPEPEYAPPPNAYRDLTPPTDNNSTGAPAKHERAPWEP